MSVSPKSPRGQSALSTSNGDGQADIIRRLYKAGAWLAYEPDDCAHGPYNGPLSLEESDVADFLIDPDIVIDRKYGVTIEHLHRWRQFVRSEFQQCTGTTKKGRRCNAWASEADSPS